MKKVRILEVHERFLYQNPSAFMLKGFFIMWEVTITRLQWLNYDYY